MSTLKTTTYSNLATLASTANTGDTYYETNNNRIVTWNGTNWTYYDNDGSLAPYSNTYSLQFDGTNEYLNLGQPTELDFNGDMTISMWIKYTNISSSYINLLSAVRVHPDYAYHLFLRNETGGSKNISFSSNGVQSNSSGAPISHNTWHHLAVTVQSGVTNGTKVYVDNSVVATFTQTIAAVTNDIYIARSGRDTNGMFEGLIDEVALFNSALSSTDVAALRDTGGANPVPADISSLNPAGWWRMGDGLASWDGTNWTIPDQTTNGNDATSVNMEEADRVSGSGNIPG